MRQALRLSALAPVLLLAAAPAFTEPPPGMAGAASEVFEQVGAAPNVGDKIYDAVLLRPLGAIQLVIGAVAFVPSYPISLPFDGDDDVLRACITQPFDRTFRRPLGRL